MDSHESEEEAQTYPAVNNEFHGFMLYSAIIGVKVV